MIVYNVTYQVAHPLHAAWLSWLKGSHIPLMLETGLISGYRIFQLLDQDEKEGLTYAVQYHLNDIEEFRTFETRYPELRNQPVPARFFPQCVAFQTVMSEAE